MRCGAGLRIHFGLRKKHPEMIMPSMRSPRFAPLWLAIFATGSLFSAVGVQAANWPSWRGPNDGSSKVQEVGLPERWSVTNNVKWRIDLPDRGNSTPVIWGDKIFVTQAIEAEKRRTLMCLNKRDGKVLWQQGVVYDKAEQTHKDNPYCAASPVVDGERVVVTHGSAGVFCYDLNGKELWRRELGAQAHEWGNASSPVLHGDAVFIFHGPGKGAFLVALDKKTGKDMWRFNEPDLDFSDRVDGFKGKADGIVGTFSTPILIKANGREELVMSFPKYVRAFDPKSGKELWRCDGLNPLVYTSLIYGDGVLVAMGGFFGNSLAVKPGGNGDVTATHRLWHTVRDKGGIGTGVIKDGHIYYHNSGSLFACLDLQTGKVLWEERAQGVGAKASTWASMLLVGDDIYMPNQSGDVVIIKANPKFQLVGVNTVKEYSNSTLAVSDGEIFFRTWKGLWCISAKKETVSLR